MNLFDRRKFAIILFMILISILFVSCEKEFIEIDALTLKKQWEDSINHTSVSWWYLGEKEGYYYLIEKWPFKKEHYKISKKQIIVSVVPPMELSLNQDDWVNLKTNHIDFQK